ncbi:MAG TPA: sialidase family protein [Steroidobacteraceae bacterium]|nr:sialidase family protein [Steroidobacteraceae bacterium]
MAGVRSPVAVLLLVSGLNACGGSSGSNSPPSPVTQPPQQQLPAPGAPLVRVSASSPFTASCGGPLSGDTVYLNAEVESYAATNPTNPANLVGIWQQDRWANGGAQGLVVAASFDSGNTWTRQALPVSQCSGDGDFARASDPWLTFSPNGVVYALSLSFTGGALEPNSKSGILVLRSADGGMTWSGPVPLIMDGSTAFDDKCSMAADPHDASFVYAVWDRLVTQTSGPTYFARTTDGGQTWERARAIYDPGATAQTIGNEIVVLPDGTVVDFYTQIDTAANGTMSSSLGVVRSSDHGTTWSGPIRIAANLAVGTKDSKTGQPVRDGSGLGQIALGPGGELFAVWQDARFSKGQRDGIAIAGSTDGGLTWSAPAQLNGDPTTQAFTPSVQIQPDGTIGVSYYDFRDDTADQSTLLTSYWLAQSTDGVQWRESRIAQPFDLELAPDSSGLFLGDYQGLVGTGGAFVPFFAQTNNDGTANRTDVYSLPPQASAVLAFKSARVEAAEAASQTPAFRRNVSANLQRLLQREVPGWDRIRRPP